MTIRKITPLALLAAALQLVGPGALLAQGRVGTTTTRLVRPPG